MKQSWEYEPNDIVDRLEKDLEIARGRICDLERQLDESIGAACAISPATAIRDTVRQIANAHGYPNLCARGNCDVCDPIHELRDEYPNALEWPKS